MCGGGRRSSLLASTALLPLAMGVPGTLAATVVLLGAAPAEAACTVFAPASGETVTCDGANTTGVIADASTNVILDLISGSIIPTSGFSISLGSGAQITLGAGTEVGNDAIGDTHSIFIGNGSTVTIGGRLDGAGGISGPVGSSGLEGFSGATIILEQDGIIDVGSPAGNYFALNGRNGGNIYQIDGTIRSVSTSIGVGVGDVVTVGATGSIAASAGTSAGIIDGWSGATDITVSVDGGATLEIHGIGDAIDIGDRSDVTLAGTITSFGDAASTNSGGGRGINVGDDSKVFITSTGSIVTGNTVPSGGNPFTGNGGDTAEGIHTGINADIDVDGLIDTQRANGIFAEIGSDVTVNGTVTARGVGNGILIGAFTSAANNQVDITIGGTVQALGTRNGIFFNAANEAGSVDVPLRANVTILEGGTLHAAAREAYSQYDGAGTYPETVDNFVIAGTVSRGNAGRVIDLQDGADTLTLLPTFSITGSIDGGNDAAGAPEIDTFVLDGLAATSATFDFGVNAVSNFEAGRKIGAGSWTMAGNSTGITGLFSVEAGSLLADATMSSTNFSVLSGAKLGGSGTIGVVSVAGGATLQGVAGQTLAMASLTLDDTSLVDATLGAPGGAALFNVAGAFTLDGRLNVIDGGGFGNGTYRLFDYSGGFTNGGLVISSMPTGFNPGDLVIDTTMSGQVSLIVAPGAGEQYWDGTNMGPGSIPSGHGGDGVWNTANTNWTNQAGTINAPWANQFAVFAGSSGGTVTIEGAQTFTGMRFELAGLDWYRFEAGAAGALVTDTADTVIEFAPPSGFASAQFATSIGGMGGLHIKGTGGATFYAANSYAGGTRIESGTLFLEDAGTVGSGLVTVDAGGRLGIGRSGDAGIAAITNSGVVDLWGHSTLGGATFSNATGGRLYFESSSSAGSAAITNSGMIAFEDETQAANAAIVNTANGVVDVSGLSGSGAEFNIGSLSGAGRVVLGEQILALGALNRNDDISGVIEDGTGAAAGLNQVVKTGSGTLTLSGINTYTGFTTVREGRLLVDGSVDGNVGVYAGTLGGAGTIGGTATIVGAGAVLEGRSGQTLTMGNLVINAGSSVNVALGAPSSTRLFNVLGDLTLDGTLNVANAGGFGEGVYRLFDYGGTLANEGLDLGTPPGSMSADDFEVQTALANQVNLVVSATPATPDPIPAIQFWNGATTTANGTVNGGSGTWSASNALTNWTNANGTRADGWNGNFAVFQAAAGTVTVDDAAGPVSVTGLQFAANGYRVEGDAIALDGAGGSTAIRVGDGSAAGTAYTATIAAKLIGASDLIKTDLGTLVLEGTHSYTGATRVDAGRLVVNGSLAGSPLTVNNGAVLGGTGMVGGIAAQSGGIVAPGNSIGTLQVAGDVGFAAGSTYEVEINAEGQSDRITAAGTATIDGGTVKVLAARGSYQPSTTYTILTATGRRTGTFADVTSNFAFLAPTLSYDANSVYLKLDRNGIDFASIGGTFNQRATGGGVEPLGIGNPIYEAVVQLDVDGARFAFDQLSGEIHASAKGMLLDDSRFVRDAIDNRLRAAFEGVAAAAAPVMAYDDGGPEIAPASTERFAIWGEAFGGWGDRDGDGNAASFDRSIGGLLIGGDTLVGDWRLGLIAGYSRSNFDVEDRDSSGDSDNYHLGLYGGTEWGNLAFRSGAAYAWHRIETERSAAFTGFGDMLSAGYDAGTAQIFSELGYGMDAGGFRFEPYANLAYVNLSTDGFTETGGAAALTGSSTTTDATFITLGLRASTRFALGAMEATARGMLGWRHAFGDITPLSGFALAGGNGFTIAGVPIAKDAALVEAGLDFTLSPQASLSLSYAGQFGSGATDQSFKANLGIKF